MLGACRRSKQDLGGLTFLGANSTVHVVKVSAQVDLADAPVDLSVVPALAVVPAALPVVAAVAQVDFADAAAAACSVGDSASAVAEELVASDPVIGATNKGDLLRVGLIIKGCASIFVRPRPRALIYACQPFFL